MSFRGGIKKGGGFWNNVDAVLTGYEFTTIPPSKDGKGEESEWVYFVPEARVDGAKDDTNQHLFLGAAEDYDISEDGLTLTGTGEVTTFGGNTPFGKFIASLLEPTTDKENGFPESDLPDLEGGDPLNLEAIIGARVRFVQQIDEEGTKKRGKRKDPKTKKEYNRTDTVIAKYYGKGKEAAKGGAKSAPATKGKDAKGSKGSKGPDIAELSGEVLREILSANDGELPKSKLSMKVLNFMLKHPQKDAREDVRKWLFEDENLESVEGVEYDSSNKKQIVKLAE